MDSSFDPFGMEADYEKMKPKNLKILNKFINEKAAPFNVAVIVEDGRTAFKPVDGEPCYKDDGAMIAGLLQGAQCFVYWLESHKYELKKKRFLKCI